MLRLAILALTLALFVTPPPPVHAQDAAPAAEPNASSTTDAAKEQKPAAEAAAEPTAEPAAEKASEPATATDAKATEAPAETPAAPAATTTEAHAAATEAEASTEAEAPAETPAEAPAEVTATPVKPAPAANIRFQFDGMPYNDVVRRFAQTASKPLIGEVEIPGTLTFFDAEPYTYTEALDTLNTLLAMKGYTLLETGRYLRLVPHSDLPQMPLPILEGSDDRVADLRPDELVTMVLPLKYIEADVAAKAVVPMVSIFGRIAPLGKGKGIVVTDRKGTIDRIRRMLSVMDSEELTEQQLLTVPLRYANVEDTASAIETLMTEPRFVRDAEGRPIPRSRSSSDLNVSSDTRTNTLILRGPSEKIAVAEAIVAKLDVEKPEEAGGDVRVFELKGAKAADLAGVLNQVIPGIQAQPQRGRRAPQSSNSSEIRIVADAVSNRLLVSAPVDRMPGIEKLIRALDKESEQSSGVRLFRLQFADAKQLADTVNNISRTTDARGRSQPALNVTTDQRSNTLIIAGDAAALDDASKLIAQLDTEQAVADAREIHVVPLKTGDAAALAQSIQRVFQQQTQGRGQQSTSGLVVEADRSTNSLIIAAAPGDWPTISKILDELKASVEPNATTATRLIHLEHADAGELAKALTAIYNVKNQQLRGKPGVVPVTIVPATRGNKLLVSGADDDLKAVAELVASMDVAADEDVDAIHMVRLDSADAVALAGTLRNLLPPDLLRSGRVSVQPDVATNSVLIRADEAQRTMIQTLIAGLDKATQATARETRLVTLKEASAKAVAGALAQLFPAQTTVRDPSGRVVNVPLTSSERVTISAAPNDRTLIIDGPADRVDAVVAMAGNLDSKADQALLQVRTYTLKTARAADLNQSLAALFAPDRRAADEPAPRFQVDARSNQLMVAATVQQFEQIDQVIEKVEQAAVASVQTRSFKLKHAQAQQVVPVLQTMLAEAAAPQQRGRGQQPTSEYATRIAAMEATNTVVVQGPGEQIALAEQLIATFDTEEAAASSAIQAVQLKNADAATMASAINSILQSKAAAQRGRQPQPTTDEGVMVTAEVNSNSLLVRGPAADVADVVAMIQKLDTQSTSSGAQLRIYTLANSDAATLAPTLGKLFQDILKQQAAAVKGKPMPPFAISADPRTNSLVVSTTPAHFSLIEQLLENLDKAADRPARDVRYVWLEHADAFSIATKLESMFADRKVGDRPVIEADSFTNALTIIGKDEDLLVMEPIIEKLDAAAKDNSVQVRVIRMSGVRATRMAEVLRTVYPQVSGGSVIVKDRLDGSEGTGSNGNNGSTTPAPAEAPAPEGTEPSSDAGGSEGSGGSGGAGSIDLSDTVPVLMQDEPVVESDAAAAPAVMPAASAEEDPPAGPVTIAVDDRANALIIAATRSQLEQIELLIAELQAETAAESDLRIFKIEAGDPQRIADVLDDLFNADKRAVIRQRSQQRDNNRNQQQQQDQAMPSIDVTLVADIRTRSVIVRAKAADMEMIGSLIEQLDQVATVISEVRVFPLKNTEAREVATNLRELLSSQPPQTGGRQTANDQRATATRRLIELKRDDGVTQVDTESLVSVTANTKTNSVVVAAPVDAMQIIGNLISELDQSAAATQVPAVRMYPMKHADVRIAAQALRDVFPQRGETRGAELPIRVTADEVGRMLIVAALSDQHELIGSILKDLDAAQADEQTLVRVYRIGFADADAVTKALVGTMMQDARRDPSQKLRINADASSNSVVVRGSADEHEQIAKLIAEIDVAPAEQYEVQLIPLRNADPATTAATLLKIFAPNQQQSNRPWWAPQDPSAKRQQVLIEADRDAKVLMVRADDETFKRIRNLAATLDATSPSGDALRTVLPLKHARAESVAPALMQAFAPPRGQRVELSEVVTVTAESGSNTLIVTANKENLEKVQSLLAKLDTEETGGSRTEFLLLKNAKAADLERVLVRAASSVPVPRGSNLPRLVVASDTGSNAIVLTGPSTQVDQLMRMAMQLDEASQGSDTNVFIIPLEKGDAATVAAMVRDMYNQQRTATQRSGTALDPLAVSADARANAVVLATTPKMHETVAAWIKEVETLKPTRGTSRIIMLEHITPEEAQKAIEEMFNRGSVPAPAAAPRGRQRGDADELLDDTVPINTTGRVDTTALPRQRAILLQASDEDYEAVLALIKALDIEAEKQRPRLRVFQLKNAANTRVAQALTQMYARTQNEEPVIVTALPQTDTIVVAASERKLIEIADIVAQLDAAEASPSLEFRIFTLQHAEPGKLLPVLRPMLQQLQAIRPGEPINVQADERTRSIIVTARASLFDQVGRIIETLDRAPAHAEADVLIVPLKHADATRLAQVLQEMLKPSTDGGLTPEARALQEQVRRINVTTSDGRKIPSLDLSKPIKVNADPVQPGQQGSHRLIITSTADNLKAMAAIVSVLDQSPVTVGVTVRLLALEHADAEAVTQTLREVFSQGRQQLAGKQGTATAGRAEPETVAGEALVSPLNVSADLRTNSLIISGREASVALAEALVRDMDKAGEKLITEVKLFPLKHADAAKLAPLLAAVFAEGPAQPGTEGLRTQVTRLRLAQEGEDRTTDTAKSRQALTIQADTTTQTLIVAARADVMPLIADVVKTMDVPGAGAFNVVRIVPLEHGDATRIKGVIDGLYTGPAAQDVRDSDRPTVQVDTRTNALVINSSDKTFAVLAALVKQLDQKTPIELRDIQIVPLKNAEAATLAPVLQEMMDARVRRQQSLGVGDADALQMFIAPDPRSNSLIVGGSKEGFELVKDLAARLDGASPALGGQIQLIPLTHANAGSLAATLQNLFNQRYSAARTADVQRQQPIILPDLRSNALLVAANADDSKVLEGLLKRMDVKLDDPAVRLVVLPMKHNDAGTVGPMIQQLFAARLQSMTAPGQTPAPQDRVDIVTDSLANALIVSASRENLEQIEALLAKVDVEPPAETGIVKMFTLQNSDAQRVATMLQNLVSQGLYKPGAASAVNDPTRQARERVSVTTDLRTNTVIVSASKENFAVIEQIIRAIDASKDFGLLGDVKLYTLKHADATRLAPTLQQFFNAKRASEEATGGSGRSVAVSVIPDARTNTLLIAGSRESFNLVDGMIARLDGESTEQVHQFRIFPLEQATATVIESTVTQLFQNRATREGTNDPVTVVADARANALIIGATKADMELAEQLIRKLDAAPDNQGMHLRIFPLKSADAARTAETIRSVFAEETGSAISISVDERMNALVASAGLADLKRIESLVTQLDQGKPADVTEIKVFSLKNADAVELAQILTDTLTRKPEALSGESGLRQPLLQFITRSQDGKDLIATALQRGVLITPDRRTNSLVVTAPVENMPLLKELIEALDNTAPRTAQIRVFALKNADARAMADVLTELFRLQDAGAADRRTVSYTLVSQQKVDARGRPITDDSAQPDTTEPAAGSEGGEVSATLGTDAQFALTVTVDVRTNSLIVGGTDHYVTLAEKMIQELDSSPAQERMTKVYRLKNAQANDIQTALRAFLDQERQRLTQALGAEGLGAAQRLLEHEVAVVAEPASNTLLLSASPRYFETVADMIARLDEAPPQVLIQVLLAEVTLDDGMDLGFEWRFTRKVTGASTLRALTDFGVEDAAAAFGGFSLAVTGDDLQFFLRALKSDGRLEVLSRPQIMATDNQAAEVNVGQRVPLITNSRITDEGTTINTISYEDVGIILQVTPRITSDGFVKMEVRPEISSLGSSDLEISQGVNATVINRNFAQTTVSVRDGQTIVIGGLITTNDDIRKSKVPLLGDIPVVGNLFKSERVRRQRRELLIILTPYIMRTGEDIDQTTRNSVGESGVLQRMEVDDAIEEGLFKGFDHRNGRQGGDPRDQLPSPEPESGEVPPAPPADRPAGTDVLRVLPTERN